MTTIAFGTGPVSIDAVEAVARRGAQVGVTPEAFAKIRAARRVVESALDDGLAHYGINTGFGSLARTRVDRANLETLQRNLIRSHSAGAGPPLPESVVRAMMVVLAASLCRGASGVRPELVEALVGMLNAGVTPVVPELGSVGASGDLAPLSHVALVLMGEGEAVHRGQRKGGREALARAGLSAITLAPKEGLALINGTHLMAARGALILSEVDRLFNAALAACAMSIDALRATDAFLDPRLHAVRAQPGQTAVADSIRGLLAGSQILPSHAVDDPRVQDPYSLRCAPVVLGAAWDCLSYVKRAIERELGAVTDNPLVFANGPTGDILSGGNFHGMAVAIPLDAAAIAIAQIGGISERRTFLMTAASDPEAHLTPFLTATPGLQSGLMIAQYTAAACVNELVGLANPASVANVPTCAGMEDYNSFGPRSAAKAARAAELCRTVVAIELLCAAQGVEHHRPLRSGAGVESALAAVRSRVPSLTEDRPPSPDIAAVVDLIEQGVF